MAFQCSSHLAGQGGRFRWRLTFAWKGQGVPPDSARRPLSPPPPASFPELPLPRLLSAGLVHLLVQRSNCSRACGEPGHNTKLPPIPPLPSLLKRRWKLCEAAKPGQALRLTFGASRLGSNLGHSRTEHSVTLQTEGSVRSLASTHLVATFA